MYLKSLEIQGFKSFPEKTTLLFHPGVTAIIGPNGSGKSNVTDAIRWVLGEQSVRSLRGGKMEDVIFSGTSTRRPLGYAEVTMLIDNSDAKLPIEYNELAITRRIYRSGESNYLINRQPCRLKDIHLLFMDSGLGRDSYSIIAQGRVDEILSTKSEDRRRVFEEASGIQKFKSKRDEAVKKLDHTEANLTRIQDILSELSGQLLPLEKQAETARQYLSWYEELKMREVAYFLEQIDKRKSDHIRHKSLLEAAMQDVLATEEEGQRLEEDNRQTRAALMSIQDEIKSARQEQEAAHQRLSELAQDLSLLKQRKEHMETQRSFRGKKRAEMLEKQSQLDGELDIHKEKTLEQSSVLERQEKKVLAVRSKLDELVRFLQDAAVETSQDRETLSLLRARKADLSGRVARQEMEAGLLAEKEADTRASCSQAAEHLLGLEQKISEQEAQVAAEEKEDEINKETYARQTEKLVLLRADLDAAQAAYNNQVQLTDQLSYRLDSLRELERNLDGYNEPVKKILQKTQTDKRFAKEIQGTVGSLLEVSQRFETAIETALGQGIQNIVVSDEQTAAALIRILKNEKMGRATFLPLNRIRPHKLDAEKKLALKKRTQSGYLGLAYELIDYQPMYAPIFEHLLGRVVVVEDLDCANRLAEDFHQTLRIVTLEGDVINPGGAITGGMYRSKSAKLISRSRELAELAIRVKENEKKIAPLEKEIDRHSAHIKQHVTQMEALAQMGIVASANLASLHARLNSLKDDRRLMEGRLSRQQDLLQSFIEQAEQSTSSKSELKAEEELLCTQIRQAEEQIEKGEERNSAQLEKRERLFTELRQENDVYQQFYQRKQAEAQIEERISHEKDELEKALQEEAAEALVEEEQIKELEVEICQQEETYQTAINKNKEENLSYAALESRQADLDQKAARLFDSLKQHNSRLTTVEAEKSRLDLRVEQLLEQEDDLRNKLWESYGLTYDNAAAFRQANEGFSAVSSRIQELKQSIRQLGAVNVNALEDYRKLRERRDFLEKQEKDILLAKAQLHGVIEELTAAMRNQFQENIAKINSNFQLVFKELFGGGSAEISLENNRDVLEADIEIKASPPGKKLQNMLLLSGGERSLSAIALLFSILKLRPTPFCVLDEIEAALDDSNVFRFTDYIKNYSDQSQFILVTHRKGTMEAADSLYGVTMQERGVSRILSMRLGD